MTTLHRHAYPNDLAVVISVLKEYPNSTIKEIVNIAESRGYFVHDKKKLEALALARDLNLINKKRNILTRKGEIMYDILCKKHDLFADLIHGLIVTNNNGFSWAYREVCRLLWSRGHVYEIETREIAAEVVTTAKEIFGDSISFSPKSVNGILHWLNELNPPVMDNSSTRRKSFKRRSFCPPELFILIIDRLYHNRDYGSNILLTEEIINKICYPCLLEISAFDRVLKYAVSQFDFVESGVGGGWGRYIVLHRKPKLEDFI